MSLQALKGRDTRFGMRPFRALRIFPLPTQGFTLGYFMLPRWGKEFRSHNGCVYQLNLGVRPLKPLWLTLKTLVADAPRTASLTQKLNRTPTRIVLGLMVRGGTRKLPRFVGT